MTAAEPASPAPPDEELAAAARRDPAAFAELYRRHVNRVYGYLLARLGDVALAQDLTAQTFLAAFEGIAGWRGQGPPAAWLLGIARHKLMDHLRSEYRSRRESVSLDEAAALAHPDPPPEQLVAERLRREQLARALRALAPERAEALALRVFGGLSAAEVGRVMGKSEAAVKMLVHRAVRDLQARLAGPEVQL
jgi:RNA polymerase sigma-70 factor (ECF subfamily)